MSVGMNQQDALGQYSAHSSRLLRRQLILQLTEQFLGKECASPVKPSASCVPSIQRLHATLLRVDVIGFCGVSLEQNPEELRSSVNEFFSKLLETIERHGGDVIRFVGDALLVVWKNVVSGVETPQEELSKRSVLRAALCAQDVAAICNNHKLRPGPHDKKGLKTQDVVLLTVRLTLSVGLMAGIDIGSDNRWEYFLIGEPLSKVAEAAEGVGTAGEVVLCSTAHSLLHSAASAMASRVWTRIRSALAYSGFACRLSCGCTQLAGGLCILVPNTPCPGLTGKPTVLAPISSTVHSPSGTREKSHRISQQLRRSVQFSPRAAKKHHQLPPPLPSLLEGIRADIDDAYQSHQGLFAKEFSRLRANLCIQGDEAQTSDERLQSSFAEWAQQCLTDDLARHVHPVLSAGHSFAEASRSGPCLRAVEDHLFAQLLTLSAGPTPPVRTLSDSIKCLFAPRSPQTVAASLTPENTPRRSPVTTLLSGTSLHSAERRDSLCTRERRGSMLMSGERRGSLLSGERRGSLSRERCGSLLSGERLTTLGLLSGEKSGCLTSGERHGSIGVEKRDLVLASGERRGSLGGTLSAVLAGVLRGSTADPQGPSKLSSLSVTPPSDGAVRRGSFSAATTQRPFPAKLPALKTGQPPTGESVPRGSIRSLAKQSSVGAPKDTSPLKPISPSLGAVAAPKPPLADVRTVSVVSVRLAVPDLGWLLKDSRHKRSLGVDHFLTRTENESSADQRILGYFQSLFEFLSDTFAAFDGQLQQFAVDGSYALCTGIFGLPGSASDDNGTSALGAAHEVSEYLGELGLPCSIGVAVGRAFCGLIGSHNRHEYAVLGHTIDLSRQLMRQASAGEVVFDLDADSPRSGGLCLYL